jgi:hypothetical protein
MYFINKCLVHFFPGAYYLVLRLADMYVRLKNGWRRRSVNAAESIRVASDVTQRYCEFNKKNLRTSGTGGKGVILMDCFPIPVWVVANGVLANRIAVRFDAELLSYGDSPRSPWVDKVYASFGCTNHLVIDLQVEQRRRHRQLYLEALHTLKTKEDLFSFSINGIQIGDEIYESYLRTFSRPTAELDRFLCQYLIYVGIGYFVFFEDFFKRRNVLGAVLSHDIYIQMGILAKIAWKNEVPVYLANAHDLKQTLAPDQKWSEFSKYPEYFSKLDDASREAGIRWAEEQLSKRLGGAVGVNMVYSTKSAYVRDFIERQTVATHKNKVVIATHCFFDNPRAYGGMLFPDFYEWISFLGTLAEETDYEWCIKTHRDFLPGTAKVIQGLVEKYPRIKLIDPNTSWHQLKAEGVGYILTCYGSVGHELPLLGFKVLNAGYNPHIAYDFNWHAKSIDMYRQILLHLDGMGEIRELSKLYEFYFVHNRLSRLNRSSYFDSWDSMIAYATKNVHSDEIFEQVMREGDGRLAQIIEVVDEFIDSDYLSEAEMLIYKSMPQ